MGIDKPLIKRGCDGDTRWFVYRRGCTAAFQTWRDAVDFLIERYHIAYRRERLFQLGMRLEQEAAQERFFKKSKFERSLIR